ncbi:hypothetical protein Q8W71_17665 [Methylobacterium sp. NEAU 140]|uniref:hypothetical protein n=1 Tax=Methylobacterium sp. NEAU 140 TaxID=3064945 RepID=UPI002732CA2D|nr:hypothetical protein [Methylobacterium sp. NEAU 140]MDP4024456.1 hypothetical protein [Methylobacterium sp. NEAU 140]
MSEAAEAIADLDDELRRVGQDVTLRRIGTDAPDTEAPGVRAFVRGYRPDELTGGIQQGDSLVVLSPTGMPAAFVIEPLGGNDRIVVAGRSLNVEYVDPVQIAGITVRINVAVRG